MCMLGLHGQPHSRLSIWAIYFQIGICQANQQNQNKTSRSAACVRMCAEDVCTRATEMSYESDVMTKLQTANNHLICMCALFMSDRFALRRERKTKTLPSSPDTRTRKTVCAASNGFQWKLIDEPITMLDN